MAKVETERKNPISRAIEFTELSWEELKKVHAPTKQETTQATIVVLVMLAGFATFLGLADFLIGLAMQSVLKV
jgi:preprotein translocase SecE subunit